jgi:hypothetical protein
MKVDSDSEEEECQLCVTRPELELLRPAEAASVGPPGAPSLLDQLVSGLMADNPPSVDDGEEDCQLCTTRPSLIAQGVVPRCGVQLLFQCVCVWVWCACVRACVCVVC